MNKQTAPSSSFFMKLAVVGSGLLAVAAGALFYYVSINKPKNTDETLIRIEVGAKACDPMDLTLPSGHHSFEIHNRSDRPVEWEILDGVMVIEERENIIPDMKAVLRAQLMPGEYEITCGLLSNPRGKLTVTPSEHSAAAGASQPDIRAYIGMLSEYKVFLIMQSNAMLKAATALQVAVKEGDLQAARLAYIQSRASYNRIEVTAGRFADLAAKIDPSAAYLEKREQDSAFTGFHRIEYGLWGKNTIEELEPVTDQLLVDLTLLKERLKVLKLTPELLLHNVTSFLQQQAEGTIPEGASVYSQNDLADLSARIDGVQRVLTLLQPLSEKPATAQTNDALGALQNLQTEIVNLSGSAVSRPYSDIDKTSRQQLAQKASELSAATKRLSVALGLE